MEIMVWIPVNGSPAREIAVAAVVVAKAIENARNLRVSEGSAECVFFLPVGTRGIYT